jgi:N-acylneuraminate cytidylyltransferase
MRLAVIPARGGSKRIPKKNIREFCGKPMIAWAIEACLASGCFDRIVVSTDDEEIAGIAKRYGAEVPFLRPIELSGDYVGTQAVVTHSINWFLDAGVPVACACCIYPTAPLLLPEDLMRGLDRLALGDCDFVFSAASFDYPVERALRLDPSGKVVMVNPENIGSRSQDLPTLVHDAGMFYWGMINAWTEGKVIFAGNSVALMIPRTRVQDIDTPEDWDVAEGLRALLDAKVQGATPTQGTSRDNEIKIRRARADDATMLYEWRNDERVRLHSFDQNPLLLAQHLAWLDTTLSSDQILLLIAEAEGVDVGVVRFDLTGREAEVSIYLNPDFIGRGLGSSIILAATEFARRQFGTRATAFTAKIRAENARSARAFKKAGFALAFNTFVLGS